MRIAVVDDDVDFGRFATMSLMQGMHDVTAHAFARPATFLGAHEAQPYDLIVCDLNLGAGVMPGMDVVRAANAIKDTPCLIVSAHLELLGRTQMGVDGYEDYVSKPLSERELIEAVQRTRWRWEARCGMCDLRIKARALDAETGEAAAAAEHAPCAIVSADLRGAIVYANEIATETFGGLLGAPIGRVLPERLHATTPGVRLHQEGVVDCCGTQTAVIVDVGITTARVIAVIHMSVAS